MERRTFIVCVAGGFLAVQLTGEAEQTRAYRRQYGPLNSGVGPTTIVER